MRLGMVALVVALALAVLSTPAPAQVPSGTLRIDVVAVLEEPTTVGDRTVFPFNGRAVLTPTQGEGLPGGELDVSSVVQLSENSRVYFQVEEASPDFTGGAFTQVVCTGTVDRAGNGSGHCGISSEVAGEGAWSGHIDFQPPRSLTLTMYLQVVCPRCAAR